MWFVRLLISLVAFLVFFGVAGFLWQGTQYLIAVRDEVPNFLVTVPKTKKAATSTAFKDDKNNDSIYPPAF